MYFLVDAICSMFNCRTFQSGMYLTIEVWKTRSEEILSSQFPSASESENVPIRNHWNLVSHPQHIVYLFLWKSKRMCCMWSILLISELSFYCAKETINPTISWRKVMKTICVCVHQGRTFCWHRSRFHDNADLTKVLLCNNTTVRRGLCKDFELICGKEWGKNMPKNVREWGD